MKLNLSAIDPFKVTNKILPTESKIRGKEIISWGTDNKYPNYLLDLYDNVVTLQSIINGTVDYICGNSVKCNIPGFEEKVNKTGETILDIIRKLARDKMTFGGYAIQVIRAFDNSIAEIYALDFSKVRTNESQDIIYYGEWDKWGSKAISYPKFNSGDVNPTSIYYNKGHLTRSVYPVPIYGAAILPCEIEKSINEFHLNNINNGFASNLIINFNNGQPDEEQQEEIERQLNEKFSGKENAGRFLIAYNDTKDNAVTIERLDSDDFDDRYSALAERSRTQIFSAFRAPSVLFGVNPDQTGFNEVEFNESFKLYNKTVVKPMQIEIIDTLDKIFNMTGSVTIETFSLSDKTTTDNSEVLD